MGSNYSGGFVPHAIVQAVYAFKKATTSFLDFIWGM